MNFMNLFAYMWPTGFIVLGLALVLVVGGYFLYKENSSK